MTVNISNLGVGTSASLILGRKLDSIPFSPYHVILILVLGLVGFVEGYDFALAGSLLVLAKEPLHLTSSDIRWLVAAPTLFVCAGGGLSPRRFPITSAASSSCRSELSSRRCLHCLFRWCRAPSN